MEMTTMKALEMTLPLAQEFAPTPLQLLGAHLIAAVIFSILRIVLFLLVVLLLEKFTPFSMIKEIVEEHNQAMGTIVGAIVLGISIIIAAAILG